MIKYPIGVQDFDKLITEDYTYVDKTKYIYDLAHGGNIFFLNRPRRFGKSLLISTLKCYFEGRKDLFKGLAIDTLEKEWKQYPVMKISFSTGEYNNDGILAENIEAFLREQEEKYGKNNVDKSIGRRFFNVIKAAKEKTGMPVVVLVDEYDKPLLDTLELDKVVKDDDGYELQIGEKNRSILKGLYSVFKDADPYLKFVFLTGVTKFGQLTVFSGFNQPADIGYDPTYEAICGISEEELYHVFRDRIKELASLWCTDEDGVKARLKKNYDGYHFSSKMTDIYNPFSILNTMKIGDLNDYWFKSGNPEYLIRLLAKTNVNIQELVGKYYSESEFIEYKADAERPLPMLYQSGYLTFKDCDKLTRQYLLDFPNDEVRKGFLTLIADNYLKTKQGSTSSTVLGDVVRGLAKGNTDAVRNTLTAFFASIPYTAYRRKGQKAKEQHFHYTFYLLLRLLSTYVIYTEKAQSQGRVDCIVEVLDYVYIFEFKLDGTADNALQQIETMGYAREYLTDKRHLKKIGCVFSSKTGTICDWKEE